MTARRPFLDYYASLGTTPVRQDISDLRRHFERRTSLYQLLGIPPRFFSLGDVLEFGPGLGHNAIHVAALRPHRHVLVDGSASGLDGLRATLTEHFGSLEGFEIVRSLVEEYRPGHEFDIVLAENMIPMQRDPSSFARSIASHVREGGILVVTCTDSVSFMGEMLRRAIALRLAPPSLDLEERIARLVPVFADHLSQLPGVSRPAEDWTKDNVTQPMFGKFFSIEDAILALRDSFDLYGGSPHFVADWRWYKQLHGERRQFNERGIEAYRRNALNLMDWRVELEPADPAVGAAVLARCDALWKLLRDTEEGKRDYDAQAFVRACEEIATLVAAVSPRTARSIREIAAFLRAPDDASAVAALDDFRSYFGRGAQYVSFIRRISVAQAPS